MFTQKVSMDCTQEQYEKYLKAELDKMGYRFYSEFCDFSFPTITNCYNNINDVVNELTIEGRKAFGRTYLGKFNAPLFLALAAMTDKVEGGYGEYWVWEVRYFTDRWEIMKAVVYNKERFMKSHPTISILSTETIRKAGVNDIMEHFCVPCYREKTIAEPSAKFGEQPKKDIFITLAFEKEAIWEDCEKSVDEYEAILLLKSKGYRIFKQTTTLEEV